MSEKLEPEAEASQTKKQFKMKKESGLKTLLKAALAKNDPGIISGHGVLLSRSEPIFPYNLMAEKRSFAVVPDGMFILPMVKSGEILEKFGRIEDDFAEITSKKYKNYYV